MEHRDIFQIHQKLSEAWNRVPRSFNDILISHTKVVFSRYLVMEFERRQENDAKSLAIQELINEKVLPKETWVRPTKYLNNIVEQDHRFIKKITKSNLGFKTFHTAEKTLMRFEAMHMIGKGQAKNNSSVLSAVEWLNKIFGIVPLSKPGFATTFAGA